MINIDPEILASMIGAGVPAAWWAWQASKKAGRLEDRLGRPNGNSEDHRTIRQMLSIIMQQVNALDERLRLHDAKQQANSVRIENVERILRNKEMSA